MKYSVGISKYAVGRNSHTKKSTVRKKIMYTGFTQNKFTNSHFEGGMEGRGMEALKSVNE